MLLVDESDIADLATFDRYRQAGLDPRVSVGDHAESQRLADRLRADGYRGVLSPSASLPGTVTLTVFEQRYEWPDDVSDEWENPDPEVWLPAISLAERAPAPASLLTKTVFIGEAHPDLAAAR